MRGAKDAVDKLLTYLPGEELPDMSWDKVITAVEEDLPTVVAVLYALMPKEECITQRKWRYF